ncbi:response regulator 21 [Hibiscus trionum]|uniref:Response regulator 21 n=1 Tax=Hibiscus trionum TaxID=183268 RepID=A0A9W7J343_HIBTR|nr:response regulator 21 [Hibiscus trionum]
MGSAERPNRREFSNPRNLAVNSPLLKITILVVDDDSTSLAIISAMLRGFRYEVTSVKNPMAALSVLRANPSNIDLVVTDLHMPEMNGIELQRQIKREFTVPVIIMSSDDSEGVMLESLAGGAVFFIVKPVHPDGLKNVWQYAVTGKKGKSVVIEETDGDSSSSSAGKLSVGNPRRLPSPVTDERDDGKRRSKRKSPGKDKDGKDEDNNPKPKKARKAKVVWTNTLHNQFLDALRHIGLEKAVPKKILEHMNVHGLTRENVASHLQKYRIFLKRIAERGCFSSKAMFDRFLKSTFAAGHPLLMKTAQEYTRMQELQRLRGLPVYTGYGGSYSPHNSTRYGALGYGNHGVSSSNTVQSYGYGQSRLLSHQGNKPLLPGSLMNPPYLGGRLPLNGGFSSGNMMNGADSLQSYPQQVQPRPGFYDAGSSSQFRFGSPGLHSSSSTLGNNGIFGSLNPGYAGTSSYGVFNENVNVPTMENQTFDYLAPGGVPPGFPASNQQANTSMLPDLDYNSDELLNNGFDLGDEAYLNELSDLILGSNKYQLSKQQPGAGTGAGAGADGVVNNPEFSFGSLFPEIYPSLDELLNSDIDESLEDNAPWNEQDVSQVQSALEELINPNTAAAADANPSNNSENTNQQQSSGEEQLIDPDLLGNLFQVNDDAPAAEDDSSNDQDSDEEEFLASLFNFSHPFE